MAEQEVLEQGVCNPEKVVDWLNNEPEGQCRPCSLAVAIPKYQEVLEKAGATEQAKLFTEALADEEDPVMKVAEAMDKVKEAVTPEVQVQLKAIDCMAQNSQNQVEEE
jgi:Tfp pilus assembly major pilin PilA